MPTTLKQSGDDPATSDLQVQRETLEDNSQTTEAAEESSVVVSEAVAQCSTSSEGDQLGTFTSIAGSEVSSTVRDPDPSNELTTEESAQALPDTSTSDDQAEKSPAPASDSAQVTSAPAVTKGFQDAFAAFASATFPGPEDEEEDMDVYENTAAEAEPGATNSSETPEMTDAAEAVVSSALDSSLVSTTKEVTGNQPQEGQGEEGLAAIRIKCQSRWTASVSSNRTSQPGFNARSNRAGNRESRTPDLPTSYWTK
ncbi:LOW QUALITY PROTEIN: hypothetical protein PoB_001447400 [Plakobranchus ocellatus]|uniref:Uncharacterized protein n=1 Tax=Plakobranchus ocellatus TaxID=259542 RepID=A0AAV3Z1M8_9GAST|nr:LOW QUALITY PROTEIN: hypothetical protein PoB_001447400 [Plakobranchus ocellatus]